MPAEQFMFISSFLKEACTKNMKDACHGKFLKVIETYELLMQCIILLIFMGLHEGSSIANGKKNALTSVTICPLMFGFVCSRPKKKRAKKVACSSLVLNSEKKGRIGMPLTRALAFFPVLRRL